MASDSLIGQTFADRYDVTGFLGEGGMGRIFIATDKKGGRSVALKVLHQHLGVEEEVVQRFYREMRAAEAVNHQHSVEVYDYGQHEGRLYLAMEAVEGDSLGEVLLDDAPLAPERALKFTRQIALALGSAHAQGIVHRDLKPDNVMIGDPGGVDIVKVCDFGLARFVGGDEGDASDFQTAVGVRVGTPHYMSPEYVGEFRSDHRSDLYSLGVLLFEMLTGSPPFDGRPYEILDAHVSTPAPAPSERVRGLSPQLDALVARMLQKDPDARFQSAKEVVQAIDALGYGEGSLSEDDATDDAPTVGGQPTIPVPRAAPTPAVAPSEVPVKRVVTPSATPAPPVSSSKKLLAGGVLVVIVLGAAAVVVLGGLGLWFVLG